MEMGVVDVAYKVVHMARMQDPTKGPWRGHQPEGLLVPGMWKRTITLASSQH
jgi:hypothetical protein